MKKLVVSLTILPALFLGACTTTMPKEADTDAAMEMNKTEDVMMQKEEGMMEEGTPEDMEKDKAMMKNEDDMMEKNEGAMMKKEDTMMQKDDGAMMKKEDTMMQKDDGAMMMAAGKYKDMTGVNLADSVLADGTTKVLFFHASWCPSCKAADQKLTSWFASPDGMLTTYKINYDNEAALKQKYGVTYQHTFVKVDGNGNMIEKKQGPSDDELKAILKS